jgi:mRNA-degrading endonuclease RelE of RelBE toxin-antitoxin system
MFKVEFSEDAIDDLFWFRKNEQNQIMDGIKIYLCHEPTLPTISRKRLRPNETSEWELRLGKFRVFYDVNEDEELVSIEAVGMKVGNRVYFRGKEQTL